MKKGIIALLAIIAVFGLAIAAYAYTTADDGTSAKTSCCKKADSCPMKSKAKKASMTKGDCCDCCGDSCPMKKGEATTTAVSTSDAGKDCCDNCDCCKGKHEMTA